MKKVFFEKIHSKDIFCDFTEPEKSNKKLVIMSHGFRGSSIGPARTFVDFSKLLLESGYSVLRFDQPNSGSSEGDFIDSSFIEWVETIKFLAEKYTGQGYTVILLGQSMGATASMIAAGSPSLKDKIPAVMLWVPDPETDTENTDPEEIHSEGGQQVKMRFWLEAHSLNFFESLKNFTGLIHLVYGEFDKYVSRKLMDETMEIVKSKKQQVMVLEGQDHSPWDFEIAQQVYKDELKFLNSLP